ncbi:MAG TPA: AAA family ATPase [Polyangiaceae bacterium]|nr:AAA family ATPase [Polyangiaceae bacterium]
MLQRLRIKNFKLLRDVELELERDIPSVLIGPNASGKSTVIEVLDFLARCATDGLEPALVAHGGMSAIRTAGVREPIELASTWNISTPSAAGTKRRWSLRWTLTLDAGPSGQVVIRSESLHDGDRVLLSTADNGSRAVVDELEPEKPPVPINLAHALGFHVLVDPNRYPGLWLLRRVLSEIRVLGAMASAPPWARASTERASARDSLVISTQAFVGREGIGLATALYNLQTDHGDAWERLHRAFRAEFPFVKRIIFPPDPGGSRIAFALEDERFPGRRIYASEMSDGMIVYLSLLSMILHPDQEAVLALDEPDAHLHPSAVRRLLALAHEKHSRRRLLIVTHSNALLDELRDPAASIRIVESTRTGARIRKLDPEALKAWRADYTLSDLRRTGLLDPSNSAYASEE